MCFSQKSSIITFIIGLLGSFALYFYGLKYSLFSKENKIVSLYFVFVSFMQLFDYLIWIDINNKSGKYRNLNKISGYLAPLFNHFQPTVLYLLETYFYKKWNFIGGFINLLYFGYVGKTYNDYLQNPKNIITGVYDNHLYWNWKNHFNYLWYFIVLFYNVTSYFPSLYGTIFIIFGTLTLLVSSKFFKSNVGELWCYFACFIPIIMILINKYILPKFIN